MQANITEPAPLRFLRARDVCNKIAVSRSRLYELMNDDHAGFPKPLKDGDSRQAPNYWIEHEIEDWMRQRMARARRG